MPLDAARDGLIELQGLLIGVLAVRNAALAQRVAQLEAANAELAERLARLERAVSRNRHPQCAVVLRIPRPQPRAAG